jgi:hypothetical protein
MLLLRPQGIFEVVKRKADLPSPAYRERKCNLMELEPARAEVSYHQLEVPYIVTVRGEVELSSSYLHLAAALFPTLSP